jgi:SAM-dependent methyltransferase
MLHGWGDLYRLSLRLGLEGLRDPTSRREALIRLAAPLEDSRLLELPHVRDALAARPGQRLLDLASPKLLAVALARTGVQVECVDLLASEIAVWQAMAGHRRGVSFSVGDGTDLAYPDASFDGAYSVSVLEHIPDGGDARALAEMGRVVRPGGRVVLTLPHGEAGETFKEAPMYSDSPEAEAERERHFYARTYSREMLDELVEGAPMLERRELRIYGFAPSRVYTAYARNLPRSAPLAHVLPFVLAEQPSGGVAQLTLVRR